MKLVEYFINISEEGYDALVHFVNEACDENKIMKNFKQTSDEMSLVDSIPVIKHELKGMFKIDMNTLNKLAIINGPRKEITVNCNELKEMSEELKKCVVDLFERTIKKHPELNARKKSFDSLCRNQLNHNMSY